MPPTPLHLGPLLLIWILSGKSLDLPSLLVGGVIQDLEPLAVLALGLNYPLHGYLHTIILATLAGALVSPLATRILGRNISSRIVLSGAIGGLTHPLLDSFMHDDIQPLYPLASGNPFPRLDVGIIYLGCILSMILALGVWIATSQKR